MYKESWLAHNWLIKKLINDKIRARLPKLSGIVIDLGCGVRPFEQDILLHADAYFGLDWGNTLHDLTANVVADLNRPLPLREGVAHHIVSFEVLEHLAEPAIMLREAWRVLRPKGELTLSMPFQWWIHEAPWDYQRFTRYGLKYQLSNAGFINIEITPTSGFWSMWILKLNYQLARLVRGPKPIRGFVRCFLIPYWWLSQTVAPILDRYWREENETAGYFVVAQKP